MTPSVAQVWDWLQAVPDPEIPAISVVDLGVVREVQVGPDGGQVTVRVTPTYSGCPATRVIAEDIRAALEARGITRVTVEQALSPPWTTDWIAEDARERLRAYGIAPPSGRPCDGSGKPAACPHCGSANTSLISAFGSTPCKAQYRCDDCLEPFDYFKCL